MGQDLSGLPVTAYALLGLLTFGDDLTGYELKQRADRTLRFYWVSPAMSQVYTELGRLSSLGLVAARGAGPTQRSSRYRITGAGRAALTSWLEDSTVDFQTLKHPVALRLLIGHVVDPDHTIAMLESHLDALTLRRAELAGVRESLVGRDGVGDAFRYPALVAEWGLEYFDGEREILERLLRRLETET